jgi:hypothetical protein
MGRRPPGLDSVVDRNGAVFAVEKATDTVTETLDYDVNV